VSRPMSKSEACFSTSQHVVSPRSAPAGCEVHDALRRRAGGAGRDHASRPDRASPHVTAAADTMQIPTIHRPRRLLPVASESAPVT